MNDNEIEKLSKLAQIFLSPAEKKRLSQEFETLMEYFSQLEEVDTSGVEALVSPIPVNQALRKDEIKDYNSWERALEQAPSLQGKLFKVPPVV